MGWRGLMFIKRTKEGVYSGDIRLMLMSMKN